MILFAYAPPPGLTPREAVVLALVASGQTCREIGQELGISHRTVETHTDNIRSKLHARNLAHAVAIWAWGDDQ